MLSLNEMLDVLVTLCPQAKTKIVGTELQIDSRNDERRARIDMHAYGWGFIKLRRLDAHQHEAVGFSGPMKLVHLIEIGMWIDGRDLDRVERECSARVEHAAAQCIEDLAREIEKRGLPLDLKDRPLSGLLCRMRSMATDLRSGNYPPADEPAPGAPKT